MDSSVVVGVVIAVAVIVVVIVVALAARTVRSNRRRAEALRLAQEIEDKTRHVERREAVAAETEARARAAEAEAEAKAAEAARLKDVAAGHRDAAGSARAHLDERRERAEELSPDILSDTAESERVSSDEPAPQQRR